MIIEIKESEFLTEIDNELAVVRIKEYYLFNKWCYKREELHSYNQALINAFKVQPEPPKQEKIGFKINSKPSKKRKKNENKSKTN
jgi:hypothetical protein